MKKVILFLALSLGLGISVNAQNNCTDLADCQTKLNQAIQMLDKSLTTIQAQNGAIDALKTENEARKYENLILKGIIENQDRLIALQQKRIGKQISLLFGLVKVRF